MKKLWLVIILTLCLAPSFGAQAQASGQAAWMAQAKSALQQAQTDLGTPKSKADLLVLTNALYAQTAGQSSEKFFDLAQKLSGCSLGSRNLIPIHSSITNPLWFSLYRRDTGKLVFAKWTGSGFKQQVIDAKPEVILTRAGWKKASQGLIGRQIFSVVSFSLTWAVNPPWPLLFSAAFHDHFCPGVNSGYIAGLYLMDKMPPQPGGKYVFVSAPGKCAADALQVMFNSTTGKASGYSMAIPGKKLSKYASGGVSPMTVAMLVSKGKNTCKGVVLGMNWGLALKMCGVKADEMAPKAGTKDPMFWVSRAKMSRELARQPTEKLMALIVPLKSFSGPAKLANQIASGDPYALAMKK